MFHLLSVVVYFSFRALIFASICAFLFRVLLLRRARRRWRIHHDGFVAPGFEKVAEVFKENVKKKQEQGAAFAVYYKGHLVVDLWGGYADYGALRLRRSDSTSMAYSATKAVTAICLALLYDRGLLDYDSPVTKYWPEFGQNGKDKISVKMLLSHRAGLLNLKEKFKLSLARDDPTELGRLLAKQKPLWQPGSGQGYHALTYGLYADQLIRRIDPQSRSLGKFFEEEIAKPFEIDFAIGESRGEFHRACRETRARFGWKHFVQTTVPVLFHFLALVFYSLVKFRTLYLLKFVGNPSDWKPRRLNDPRFREISCGSSHGFGTARALAKLMGIVAAGGKEADGRVLLTTEAVRRLSSPLSSDFDRVVLRKVTFGPGTQLLSVNHDGNKSCHIFGHFGAGGQMAFCDPDQELGWAYLTNYSNILHGFVIDHRYKSLEKAMYQCVNAMNKLR